MDKMKAEIELMKADVMDRMARAQENEIDAQLKQQKVQVEAAKARNLNSTADLSDLEFLERDSGVSARERMQELQAKHDNEMSKLHAQYMAELDHRALDAIASKDIARYSKK
jgi:multidrug resistance efflux pump